MKTRNLSDVVFFSAIVLTMLSCKQKIPKEADTKDIMKQKIKYVSYANDVKFIENFMDVISLTNKAGTAKVAVVPALQGRVMTSSAAGDTGRSFGWINRKLFTSGETQEHIHIFGGEERFWIGPEGGQYSIFFKGGSEFNLENWYTPQLIDLEPFEVKSVSSEKVLFTKKASLTNYSDFQFHLGIEREVAVLSEKKIRKELDLPIYSEDIMAVGYQTKNTLRNTGKSDWKKDSGLLSIWILGMYNASPKTTIIIPFKPGNEEQIGRPVTDDYFGKVPSDRLIVKDSVLYFSGDAKFRSKIGLSPSRAKNILGSYDAANKILTIVKYKKPEDAVDYVNSIWKIQENPYEGDVVNSYNDGPPAPGDKQLGEFYELETSSPALALKAGDSATHIQTTFHFQGDAMALDSLSIQLLGVSLKETNSNINFN